MSEPTTLSAAACAVLLTADARHKAQASAKAAAAWKSGAFSAVGSAVGDPMPPDRPARPARPELRLPRDMPKRQGSGPTARIALLHALAHIELNAIDLAWDIIARFGSDQPRAFVDDWMTVADEEAKHFLLLDDRLNDLGAGYGDLPAHDGLWEAAIETSHDVLARLAIVPLVLEARGLDVTPAMIDKLDKTGDTDSADILRTIYRDEIGHVAIGVRWFETLCQARKIGPQTTWKALVNKHFRGKLKPPFNDEARQKSGFDVQYYANMA